MQNQHRHFMPPKVGTKVKLVVGVELPGEVHLMDCDFELTLKTTYKKKVYTKDELIPVDEDHYYVLVDTEELGAGQYMCVITVEVPDSDFPTGLRTEKIEFPTDLKAIP